MEIFFYFLNNTGVGTDRLQIWGNWKKMGETEIILDAIPGGRSREKREDGRQYLGRVDQAKQILLEWCEQGNRG
jgi:hypothetical protein